MTIRAASISPATSTMLSHLGAPSLGPRFCGEPRAASVLDAGVHALVGGRRVQVIERVARDNGRRRRPRFRRSQHRSDVEDDGPARP
jgi:hypothetical protein